MDNKSINKILQKGWWEREMLPWEHCGMKFYHIPYDLIEYNIQMKNILFCNFNDEPYYFNIGTDEPQITDEMKKDGYWAVYTWAD